MRHSAAAAAFAHPCTLRDVHRTPLCPSRRSRSQLVEIDQQWSTAAWLETVGVSSHIARALRARAWPLDLAASPKDDLAVLRRLGRKSEAELLRKCQGLDKALLEALLPALRQLATADAATPEQLHHKFQQDPDAFELQFDAVAAFHGGLEAAIGPPDPNVRDAMEREHTASPDSLEPFTTANYLVTTTPADEWWFVAEPERERVWPVEGRPPSAPKSGARPRPTS